MLNRLLPVALGAMLAACTDSVDLVNYRSPTDVRLSATDSIVVNTPQDGVYGSSVYHGSGRNTAQIISAAFAKHTSAISRQSDLGNIAEAHAQAKKDGHDYLVYPLILHWEDRATEWSGRPDRVEVRIDVIDVESGDVVATGIASGKSGLATFGGDHPQDLLPEPADEFVSSLY